MKKEKKLTVEETEANEEIGQVNHEIKTEVLEENTISSLTEEDHGVVPYVIGADAAAEGTSDSQVEVTVSKEGGELKVVDTKPKRKRAKKVELTEEEKFVFIYSENEKLLDMVKKQAAKDKMTVVLLSEDDFKAMSEAEEKRAKGESKIDTINEFVRDPANFQAAEEHAVKLLGLVTDKRVIDPMGVIHTETEVVRKTTLSHRQASEILNLLSVFGFIKFTKGTYEFQFTNNPQAVTDLAIEDVNTACESLVYNVARLKAISEGVFDDKEKAAKMLIDLGLDIERKYSITIQ